MTSISATLVTGSPGNLIPVGSESNLKLRIFNFFIFSRAVNIKWNLSAPNGVVYYGGNVDISINANSGYDLVIPLTGQSLGHRWIDYVVTWSTGQIKDRAGYVYTRAKAGQVRDVTSFEWGMNPSLTSCDPDFDAMMEIGITSIRTNFLWQFLEFPHDFFHWYVADRQIELAEQHGMRVMWTAGVGNIFATKIGSWLDFFAGPPSSFFWTHFLHNFAKRYGKRITWYELWPKPNVPLYFEGNSDDYLEILRDGYRAIKCANPQALIVSGGFEDETFPGISINHNVQRRVLQEASQYFDIHAIHSTRTFADQEANAATIAPWRAAMKIKHPVWPNESGMTTAGAAFTPSIWLDQARETVKKIVDTKAKGYIGYTISEIADLGFDLYIPEFNYGIMTIYRQPKPSFGAINEVISRIRHYSYYGTLSVVPSNSRFYIFKGPRGYLTYFWKQSGSPSGFAVEVGKNATASDMWGNPVGMSASGTQMTIAFDVLPQLIESSVPPTIPVPGAAPGGGGGASGEIDNSVTTGPANTQQVNALAPFARLRCRERTTSGGLVTSFNDLYRVGHQWLPVDSNKVADPTQRQRIAWRDGCSFTGLQQYRSNLTAPAWAFLHGQNPHEIFIVLISKVTASINDIATTVSGTLANGWKLAAAAGSGIISSSKYGTTGQVLTTQSSVVTNGNAIFIRIRSNLALGPQESMITNESSTDGEYYGFTPTVTSPAIPLTIGDGTGNGFELAEMIFFDRALSDDERAIVVDYVVNWYDLNNLSDYVNSLSPFSRIRARERTESVGKVAQFNDLIRIGHTLGQGGPANQILAIARSSTINDRELAVFTGSQQYISSIASSFWDFLHVDHEKEVFLVIIAIINGVQNTILTTSADRFSTGITIAEKTFGEIMFGVGALIGQQNQFLSSELVNGKPTVANFQSDIAQNTPAIRLALNSEQDITSDFQFAPTDISTGQTLLLGDLTADSMKFAEYIIFNKKLMPAERQKVRQYVAAWYGIAAPIIQFTNWTGSGTVNPTVLTMSKSTQKSGTVQSGSGSLGVKLALAPKARKTSYAKGDLKITFKSSAMLRKAPGVHKAIAMSTDRVRLEFDARMSPDTILKNPLNYQISPVFEGGVGVFVKAVIVPVGGYPLYIDLDVSEMTNGALYRLEVTLNFGFPVDQHGLKLSLGRKGTNFVGVGDAPIVKYIASVGPNRIDITFSKVMLNEDSIRNPLKYQWSDGLQTIQVLGVVSNVVQLVTSDQIPGHKYRLNIPS